MKILIVCSANSGSINSFITEQVDSLSVYDIEFDYFGIRGKGAMGYLGNLGKLHKKINNNDFDLIHAHYGLSGFLANMQYKVPVITTYHGSDVHYSFNRFWSRITSQLSVFNIVTNKKQITQLSLNSNFACIPCGIDTSLFKPLNKKECKKRFGFSENKKYVLFSSSFERTVKNAALAQSSVKLLPDTELIELKGYTREQVALLINAVDAVLITSFYETGPLIAKEALACNVPVISTDVGDVSAILDDYADHLVIPYDSKIIAERLKWIFRKKEKVDYRNLVCEYDLDIVAQKINNIYGFI